LQDAHDPEMGVFLDLGLSAGHGFGVVSVSGVAVKCFKQAIAMPCHDQHTHLRCSGDVGRHCTFVRSRASLP
jgi:hypothetical protein